jgi:Tol biopolymer transport system component
MAFVSRQGSINQIYLMDDDASGVGSKPTAIYVINADGSGQQRLSPTPGFDVTSSWSPDGAQIVYARLHEAAQANVPPMTDIRAINADGTGDHAALANTLFSVEPRWSVYSRLVFISLMDGSGEMERESRLNPIAKAETSFLRDERRRQRAEAAKDRL